MKLFKKKKPYLYINEINGWGQQVINKTDAENQLKLSQLLRKQNGNYSDLFNNVRRPPKAENLYVTDEEKAKEEELKKK